MEELRKAILFDGILKTNFHDDELKRRLFNFQPLEFIPYFLLDGDISYNNIFFLSNMLYWEKLDYSDWKELLIKVSDHALGIYSFFVITYKYLEIDMIPFFKNLDSENQEKKEMSLKRFFENPHILQHDNEAERLIKMYSLDSKCLNQIRKKLLLQGAMEAQKIEPRKKLRVGYTVVKPPSSWYEWARDLPGLV